MIRFFVSSLLGCTLIPVFLFFQLKPAQGQYQHQNPSVPFPSILPLDTELATQTELGETLDNPTGSVITENTINQTSLTLPSLWWASTQYGKDLLATWLAYPSLEQQTPGRVDLVVNRQAWRDTCYFNRYEFVTKMGAIARDYGYNTRIFNRQGDALAAYTCNFEIPNLCNVQGLAINKGVNQNCVIN